mmetsp:Transcript_10991/g.19232  ORF Transcript_10991/g.19232 Transcript_10991/m.19232 type:complete len:215 (+) Transcript_10991:699-1343(+)
MRRFLRKARADTPAPENIPAGMRNMLATLCSTPMATNAMTGIHRPTILPVVSLADVEHCTARQTRALQMMAWRKSWRGFLDTAFVTATLEMNSPTPGALSRPAAAASAARLTPPTRFPRKANPQFLRRPDRVIFLARNAVPETMVLPVNISAPLSRTSWRPKGKTSAQMPLTIPQGRVRRCPPIVHIISPARPIYAPAMMPRRNVFLREAFALA